MIVVLDASVVLKWPLEDPAREPDTDKASAIIESVVRGRPEILQPVHWLAEVAASAARLTRHTAVGDVEMLTALRSRPVIISSTRCITPWRLSTKTHCL